jgi:glutaminyl-peptide cyclotransferase
MNRLRQSPWIAAAALAAFLIAACGHNAASSKASPAPNPTSASSPPSAEPAHQFAVPVPDAAPPASQTGGFDGAKAYDHVAKLVSFGPHPPASAAIHNAQNYIRLQLQSYGCAVYEDNFNAQTPIGTLAMKNIVAKVPGTGQGIIVLMTHYDTKRVDNFVGAEDSGSSTGLMLEMARLLCARPKQPSAVWIVFVDGEETQATFGWNDDDSVYGSRELAASMAVSGDLKKIKALILADMIGQENLVIPRESDSTKWLINLIFRTAARLGYSDVFVQRESESTDDHGPFLKRGVPSADVIDLDGYINLGYWHTPQDTLDKISPRSLAIVGHVILESVNELQNKFR